MNIRGSSPAPAPDRIRVEDFDWAAPVGVAAEVRRVLDAAAESDRRGPLNEQTLLSLRHGGLTASSLWVSPRDSTEDASGEEIVGFALVDDLAGAAEVGADLVVHPAARRAGVGESLASAVLAEFPSAEISAWSHGNHPAASRLAERHGFARVRDLWIMRLSTRQLVDAEPSESWARAVNEFVIRTFHPGQDEDAFLEVNAAAFADHREQGGLTRGDLDQRMSEPWFDPTGFFLAESSDGELLGFHWTKVHGADGRGPAYGEVYVVGIAPDAQGMGLGKALTMTGLRHLAGLGLDEVILYVESDNAPAIAIYERLGFRHAGEDTDVMYARTK